MSLTPVTCLGMAGSLFEGAWVGGGLGFSPGGKMERRMKGCCGLGQCGDRAGAREGLPQPHTHPLPPRFFPPCPGSRIVLAPSGPPAPTAASFSPAASDARPAVSSISAQTMSLGPNPAPRAPLAEQPRRDLPVGGRPPLLPGAATAVSTDLDARAPVQESVSGACVRRGHEGPFWTGALVRWAVGSPW